MILQLYQNEKFDQNQRKTNFPKALVEQSRQNQEGLCPWERTAVMFPPFVSGIFSLEAAPSGAGLWRLARPPAAATLS